jgi:uncharacterized protein YfaS (alpha-2-macroglobulin family)
MRILSIFLLLCLWACRPQSPSSVLEEPGQIDLAFATYVSSYTNHKISRRHGEIKVRFTRQKGMEGDIVDPSTYKVTPTVKGEMVWIDSYTVAFQAKEVLESNTKYTLRLFLDRLFEDVPKDIQVLDIPMITKNNELSIYTNAIDYTVEDNFSNLSLSGWIRSTDYLEEGAVEKMLDFQQKGNKNLEILWEHRTNTHQFTINGIERREEEDEVILSWDGSSVDPTFKSKRSIRVARIGQFSALNAEIAEGANRAIDIYFSQTLNTKQDVKGLIRIKDYKGALSFDIQGQRIRLFPKSKLPNPVELIIEEGILDLKGRSLEEGGRFTVSFGPTKPLVRLMGQGVIVPQGETVIFPFEAINLKSARVEIFKIFQDNVLQMLQYNPLTDPYRLQAVGRVVHTEVIDLSKLNPDNNYEQFVRYALDLKKMTDLDPGAIYQVSIHMNKDDVYSYPCEKEDYDSYRYEDPCSAYYYSSRTVTRNVLASNIGIIVKREMDDDLKVVLSDLKTLEPIDNASVTAYDFQQQELASTRSDINGLASLEGLSHRASFIIVREAGQFGYVNIQDANALSNSEFEVSGRSAPSGISGYIYGDRGVWRPGDTLFLNFMLQDAKESLPKDHPVQVKVVDARGKTRFTQSSSVHLGHLYDFPVPTKADDPTGNWTVTVKVGNQTFRKSLNVETIKPNRLKIEIEASEALSLYQEPEIDLRSEWLHGAKASGLKARVDMKLQPVSTQFKGYADYAFDDPARRRNPQSLTLFDGNLDEAGKAGIEVRTNPTWQAPGKLRASFTTKVFEKSGNFSEDNFTQEAHLYASYVGIKVPRTRWGSRFIQSGKTTSIPIVVLDTEGQPIKNRTLSVGLYTAEWNWWYDRRYNNRYSFNSSQHNGAVSKGQLTSNEKGEAFYEVNFEDWGNYMIRVCDEETGHCTGDLFYTGRYWSQRGEQEGPQQLRFTTDQSVYNSGEAIQVSIPSNAGARILVSVEDGQEVLSTFWVDAEKDQTQISIPTEAYPGASTLYISAHLVQAHNQGENDLALRMYGLVPVQIKDPNTELHPQIAMDKSIRPGEQFEVKVSEQNGKAMVYTISMVDEGLLSLTRFKTPNPWSHFYAKQALGVKTWDIYDLVLNKYGGDVERYISIGGDGSIEKVDAPKEANRFKPVVKHLGPFYLKAGEKARHPINMPNYVGAVRTMVVARNGSAYGSAEESTLVKKPLMVLSTLPRVLGPNEEVQLPVNVFAMDDKIKSVQVSASTSKNLQIQEKAQQELTFSQAGDQLCFFEAKVGPDIGVARIKTKVQSGREESEDQVDIEIRNPNPTTTKVVEAVVQPGERWEGRVDLHGSSGSNSAVLEVSQIPPMDFDRRLGYLIRYPYGCVEQTTSAAFPQLYLNVVTELSEEKQRRIDRNIRKAIDRLALFQRSNGGFSYWPGNRDISSYGTVYASHFLSEAKSRGYNVSNDVFKDAMDYLYSSSDRFDLADASSWKLITQAYSLYVLAKNGRPNIGAMNRLRTLKQKGNTSTFLLAAAYALIGKKEIASILMANQTLEVEAYRETGYSYGSDTRDLAMMAESLQAMGREAEAAQIIKQLSKRMSSLSWYSTQEIAYTLLTIGQYLQSYQGGDLAYAFAYGKQEVRSIEQRKPIGQHDIDLESLDNGQVWVENKGSAPQFIRILTSGQLPPGEEEEAYNRHLQISVQYMDREGSPLDPAAIPLGTDFKVVTTVENLGTRLANMEEVALSQIFPSGWEIQNERLRGGARASRIDYQDVRDDRVYSFFDLNGRRDKVVITTLLTASYAGKFYLPPVSVEAMYDHEIQAKTKGQWVEVVR